MKFRLETGNVQRTDIPCIPREVVREALANALMHRDYRAGQPTLVIRYSYRLEFKNAGYSLKPFEELGKPGSRHRNLIIATVFHDLKYAEVKGTGIKSMREWMQKAGLTTPPIIETNRDSNEFDLLFLPHHLLDRKNLEWLSLFKIFNLSDAECRALVLVKEMQAITNLDYRQINGVDTLGASKALGRLRNIGLLDMKGAGSGVYYVLSSRLAEIVSTDIQLGGDDKTELVTSQTDLPDKVSASQVSLPGETVASQGILLPPGFPNLSDKLKLQILSLSKKNLGSVEFEQIIINLCSIKSLTKKELAKILNRNPNHLQDQYLTRMVKNKTLEYLYPQKIAHPKLAYKTSKDRTEVPILKEDKNTVY